jgi:hypothetical protein
MRIPLCRFRLSNHIQPQPHPRKTSANRGQIIVIFAVTLLALLFFAGLAIDSGSLYVTYSQLRRSIDAAAVAAANDYKAEGEGGTVNRPRMTNAALEVLKLHGLAEADMNMKLYLCADTTTAPADFLSQCPVAPDSPRKLVRIDATLQAPLYFLYLLGFHSVPLSAHSIAEAAPIDLVIVIDTSESMANETPGYDPHLPYDPYDCNQTGAANPCEPLNKAKVAAKGLIDTMYDGYDHIGIVHFDVTAPDVSSINMRESIALAKTDVDNLKVHNDPPYSKIMPTWYNVSTGTYTNILGFNPVYPEDRDGDGLDADVGSAACTMTTPAEEGQRWDAKINPYGLIGGGAPCDEANKFDAYDWDDDGVYTANDDTLAKAYLTDSHAMYPNAVCDGSTNPPTCSKPYWTYFTPNSTCTGCGIRVGAQVLKKWGRANAVWVMVFLSDGLVNLSDTPATNPNISASYPLGYCTGGIGSFMWSYDCVDIRKNALLSPRYCLDNPNTTCPPGSISTLGNPERYSVYDYALDMVDYAALMKSTNLAEIPASGSNIAIYSIGLGGAGDVPPGASGPIGEYLLRYMAAVGDDGERLPDPCATTATKVSCGQYYYTSTGTGLGYIFTDISTRIYSRLTQ